MKILNLLLLIFFFSVLSVSAQGIRGTVKDKSGETLPYASIYVIELKDGASTNMNGKYEIKLSPGTYTLKVQYLGYQTQQMQVRIKDSWVEQDFILPEQVQVLREVEIQSKRKEDPAYTIMRKAIAKRKYHLLQYDSYQVKMYIKGTGQVTDVPFFAKKKLEEEGISVDEAYTSESVSIVKFEQPNKIEEKVISIRSSGPSGGPSPSPYINQSFYQDKIGSIISPLSGAAFAYYKFRLEGSYIEGNQEINKIRVIPRSKGDDVMDGWIYIIEDLWAIHSLDLSTTVYGFQLRIKQNYAEVAPKLWMPINHQYKFWGKAMGFAGEFLYLASASDYEVKLNEDLVAETVIIDEKIEEVPADLHINKPGDKDDIVETLAKEDKMTKKQFRKMINQYEKESLKAQKDPQVVRDRSHNIDSLAYKQDSAYWAAIRPVPLTEKEIKGYQRDDSLALIETAKLTGKDSAGVIKKKKFSLSGLAFGGRYDLSPKTTVVLDPTLFQLYYNTVEGFNVNFSGKFIHRYDSLRKQIVLKPTIRYGLASDDVYAKTRLTYAYSHTSKGRARDGSSFYLEGGKFVSQFNETDPIHPHINTISSLLFRSNFMKIYEKTYGIAGFNYKPSAAFSLTSSLEWAQRNELFDQTNYSFYNGESRIYTSNRPQNVELENTVFPEHQALIFKTELSYRPGLRYGIYNGRKYAYLYNSPQLLFMYRKGIRGAFGSDVDFDQIQLGVNHGFDIGVSGRLEYELKAGTFLNSKSLYFMDYQHFDGNRTILSSMRPAGAFRLLDYYQYSTKGSYFSGHTHYQFRKFLLTQLPMLRFTGLKENIFVNYLKTGSSPHYYELGYGIDNIFRVLRIEVAASFKDNKFQEIAPRIGIATVFKFNSNDD